MMMTQPLPPYAADRIDARIFAALHGTLNDGRYAARGEAYGAFMLKCAVLTIVEGPAYLESLYAGTPARLAAWNAEKEKLAPLLERLTADHRRIEADRKIKQPPKENRGEGSREDHDFLRAFHATLNNEGRALRTQLREAVYYNSDPAAETARVMNVDSPFDRVIEAAGTIRAGRRLNTRALHYFKS